MNEINYDFLKNDILNKSVVNFKITVQNLLNL